MNFQYSIIFNILAAIRSYLDTMKIIEHPLIAFIFSSILVILECSPLETGTVDDKDFDSSSKINRYKQSLRVTSDNMVQTSFQIPFKFMPLPLQKLTINSNSTINILYGPYFHQVKHVSYNLSSFNGITTEIMIQKESDIQPYLKQILEATFLVSISKRYGYYFQELNSWIFNDPNDKFCVHHIEEIVRNLLPCAANAGLAQLLDTSTMFSLGENGHRLYGMRVLWNSNSFHVKIFVEMDKKIFGLKKIKLYQKCLKESQLIVLDGKNNSIGLKQIVLNRLQQSFDKRNNQQQEHREVRISKQIVGNWYNPEKNMLVTVYCSKLRNNSQIIVREIMPSRGGVLNIQLINYESNVSHVQFSSTCSEKNNYEQIRFKQANSICKITISVLNYVFEEQSHHFSLIITLAGKITNFDNYQSIFGGGTQISNIPITLISPSNQSLEFNRYFMAPASLRTPQPDQSLPFQVITFVVGIFGYLWISIWRKLVYDLQQIKESNQQFK